MSTLRYSVPFFALLAGLLSEPLRAQVVEPNGVQAPRLMLTNGETSLQTYFDAETEAIDALEHASAEPGVFSPRCDFTATLVMSESSGSSGLAWYNVPQDPNSAPPELYQIVPEASGVTGQVFEGTDIRNDPNYEGGSIGFTLTQKGGVPVYYSEFRRNEYCTLCSMPDYWKMMLVYRSTVHQSSYYLGFEDWEGANEESWGDNDGDFQDKVFLVTGVSCAGGGEPCDTGQLGACAAGLTDCALSGESVCKPQTTGRPEKCDNIDNDCNAQVDDGDLCPSNQVCVRGQCVGKCSAGEFVCPIPLECGSDGYCVDPACKDVVCGPDLACRAGACVGICQGVVCPSGQICQFDRCIDPCAGVTCPTQSFCDRGVCVGDCSCSGCPTGKECATDGRCVPPGCASVTCAAGQACRAGQCVPACEGAVCPGGASCSNGTCGEPQGTGGGGGGGTGGMTQGTGGILIVTQGGSPPLPPASGGSPVMSGGAPGAVGGSAAGKDPGARLTPSEKSGCACRAAAPPASSPTAGLLLTALAAAALRRRPRRALSTDRIRDARLAPRD